MSTCACLCNLPFVPVVQGVWAILLRVLTNQVISFVVFIFFPVVSSFYILLFQEKLLLCSLVGLVVFLYAEHRAGLTWRERRQRMYCTIYMLGVKRDLNVAWMSPDLTIHM